MKATGIVRRIDDLGRVVVPKEIRRTLRIREGDPLEIFTDKDGEIILKKYSPIGELSAFAQEYADSVAAITGNVLCICDRDQIIAVAGVPKKDLLGKSLSKDLEEAINNRDTIIAKKSDKECISVTNDSDEYGARIIHTIICEGDAIGAVILMTKDDKTDLGEMDKKIVQIAANFLGKQMEN